MMTKFIVYSLWCILFFLFVLLPTVYAQEVDQAQCTADCPSGATCQLQTHDFPSASMKVCSTSSVNLSTSASATAATAAIYHVSIKNNSAKTITGSWPYYNWKCDMDDNLTTAKTLECSALASGGVQQNVSTGPILAGATLLDTGMLPATVTLTNKTGTGYCGAAQSDIYHPEIRFADGSPSETSTTVFWGYADSTTSCPPTVTTSATSSCTATPQTQAITASWNLPSGARSYQPNLRDSSGGAVGDSGTCITGASKIFSPVDITGTYRVDIVAYKSTNCTDTGGVVTGTSPTVTNASCTGGVTGQPFSVSCSGSVSGQTITWTANAVAGTGTYSYSWSGDDGLTRGVTNTTSVTDTVSKTYTGTGTKSATIKVTSPPGSTNPAETASASCQATIDSSTTNPPPNCTNPFNLRVNMDTDNPPPLDSTSTIKNIFDEVYTYYSRVPVDTTVTASSENCGTYTKTIPHSLGYVDFMALSRLRSNSKVTWTFSLSPISDYQFTQGLEFSCVSDSICPDPAADDTKPIYSSTSHQFSTGSSTRGYGLIFSFQQTGTISGHVFSDTNYNRQKDQNEGGFDNITVNLIQQLTSQIISTTKTDSAGNYRFTLNSTQLGISYNVGVIPPAGYGVTTRNPQSLVTAAGIALPNSSTPNESAQDAGVGALPGAFSITSETPSCNGSQSIITVNWSSSTNADRYVLSMYKNNVYDQGVPLAPNAISHIVNVTGGNQYSFSMSAYNNAGSYAFTSPNKLTASVCDALPTVITNDPLDITSTTATLNGTATVSTTSSAITEHGFLYIASNTAPTTGTGCTVDTPAPCTKVFNTGVPTGTDGAFTKGLTNLTVQTTYQVMAYAKNSAGAGYGVWKPFTTNLPTPGSFTLNTPLSVNSTSSNGACLSPGKPTVYLSWTASANVDPVTRPATDFYEIYRGAAKIGTVQSSASLFYTDTDSTLAPNTSYNYKVKAFNTAGSTESSQVTVKTAYCDFQAPVVNFLDFSGRCYDQASWGIKKSIIISAYDPAPPTPPSGIGVVRVRLNGANLANATPTGPTQWLTDISWASLIQNSTNTITTEALDMANNTSLASQVTFRARDVCAKPWIKTRDGDIHSNTDIRLRR